jgi:hypothetical protein
LASGKTTSISITPSAQPLRIALADFGKVHDLACEYFVGKVAAINEAKGYQRHFKASPMIRGRLWVELLSI